MIKYLLEMFFISLILTIAIELVVIWLFSRISRSMSFIHKKQGIFLVVLVNVLTNPPAVLICWIAGLYLTNVPAMIVQLLTEAAVVIVEAWVYHVFDKEKQWDIRNPVILSCVANICAWLCGIALMAVRDILIKGGTYEKIYLFIRNDDLLFALYDFGTCGCNLGAGG